MQIRPCTPADLSAVTAIYQHHVLHGSGSFEIEPPDLTEMTHRYDDVISKPLPYLVAILDDAVLGYAYANFFRPRPAYRFCVENSVYVAQNTTQKGIGRALMTELMRQCEVLGARQMVAVIGDSANKASISLHTSLGFSHTGQLQATGWKHNRWLDTVLMQKTLGLGNESSPSSLN
ncbi:MAG: N-acetyltransferase family protein [Betaproteobacteria bacterium]|jgi:phosphinothricin acetyltransferase|nr:N-acetyltransferase family protein [Betaproteobacteria bacterium]NBT68801.1 N-acetyltransferase family protein [Betaproteobacteria bacterium]NBY08031.1 N-acetyltransferase family protein [Betaproteobacteria bacterium]